MKIAFLAFGVHQPKSLSEEQMMHQYTKFGYTRYPIFIFPDSSSYYDFIVNKRPKINGVYIFNKEGKLLNPKTQMTCSSGNFDYLEYYDNQDSMVIDTSFTISKLSKSTRLLHPGTYSQSLIFDSAKQYNIVLCFADFMGKINIQSTSEYIKSLERKDTSQFSISLLSLDPLKK